MKKKLFVVASLVSLYALFVFSFPATARQGEMFGSTVEVMENTLLATTSELEIVPQGTDMLLRSGFRDPMPPPLRKPKPRR